MASRLNAALAKLPWYGQIGLFVVVSLALAAGFYYQVETLKQAAMAARGQELSAIQERIARGQQMARLGNWKAVRQGLLKDPRAPIELYDIGSDPGETNDVAAANPALVAELRRFMIEQRRPSKEFAFPALDRPAGES